MSESFYRFTLKKRRKGRTLTPAQRLDAQAAFLEAYEHSANMLRAAEQAEISREIVYYWLEHDERFLFAYHLADAAANAHIEAEIRRRAMEGVLEPVVSQGQLVYEYEPVLDDEGNQKYDSKGKPIYERGALITVRKYSDTLLIFYAKRRMPEYREKQSVDVNTAGATQDMRALQDTLLQALSAYPDAKVAVAEALMRKSREHGK
jgi:hypothetical protein